MGGASVLNEVCKWFPKNIIASDYNEDLIIMWQALKDGWMPPDNYKVDQNYYYSLFDKERSPLRTFILFSCSFGGGWKNTIARANKGFLDPHLYYNRGRRSLNLKWENIKNANCQFAFCSYENYKTTDYTNTIFYCDSPYRNTIGYKGSKEKFDHNKFDEWCRGMSKNNLVIISEYNMPTDFEAIFEKNKPNSLQAQMGKTDVMVEKIFIHPNSLEWIVS